MTLYKFDMLKISVVKNSICFSKVNASGSQVVKKNGEIIPVAVALVETVNAHFKGKDTSR
jgi:hypothetical protein